MSEGNRKKRAVMVMFDSLNRHMLSAYGCEESVTPNFRRLSDRTIRFENCYAGSLPCMPARRELHTGRYNFLHRSWGPVEPFDDSMPAILKENGIHSHLASDHVHYWELGGGSYHTQFSTWECFRGQEGDPWKGMAGGVKDSSPNLVQFEGYRGMLYQQDLVNRTYLQLEEEHPQARTFAAGMEFIRANADHDRWFLQLETFDPHEPFFSYQKYRELYPGDYQGPRFDWPDYAPVTESVEAAAQARREYMALLSMCDNYLGKVLDLFDELNLWEDTMLIVNTDHGFLLGEHGCWGKSYMPFYNEIVHIPLFLWDPDLGIRGESRSALVQTIDLPATLLAYFDLDLPTDMQGKPLTQVIRDDTPVRTGALFGLHGGHICCTDGQYVCMKAPAAPDNQPLYNYTLIPAHMAWFFTPAEIRSMCAVPPFSFTKGMPVMRFDNIMISSTAYSYGDLLFDVKQDPRQQTPLSEREETENYMKQLMKQLMEENDAPQEQFNRVGLVHCPGEIKK